MIVTERDVFAEYSPLVNFIYFAGAVIMGMVFMHPAFLTCACIISFIYYVMIRGMRGLKLIAALLPMIAAVVFINPVFNTLGDTVLFKYMGGRPYTLEALYYGMAIAAMFAAVIMWFGCYNAVVTSDKFIHVFGRRMPALSLVLTMALRFVPTYVRRLAAISSARKGLGRDRASGGKRGLAEDGAVMVSALISWALESGIVTSDSMRSRGYGSGVRTCFSIYRFDARDRILLSVMLILLAVTVYCCAFGAAEAEYIPSFSPAEADPVMLTGLIAYGAFLAIPVILNILEVIKWRILRSKI